MARSTKKKASSNGKKFATQQSLDAYVWSICNILRRSNCQGALQYVPELTWILFLRILDEREQREAEESEAVGISFIPSLESPYRWQDWAAPFDEDEAPAGNNTTTAPGWKRQELTGEGSTLGSFFSFVNTELLPHLHKLKERPNATPRQKVISEIMSGVERTRVDTEKNLLDILDMVHKVSQENVDDTHIFALSQVYEGLLLKMGEKGNDGGQFFTPREIIRAIVQTLDPKPDETVYDPCCGTGGFLAQVYEYLKGKLSDDATAEQLERLKHETFYGREKENLIYPIGLANLMLHGIDQPNIWHGNTLTGNEVYSGLFLNAPSQFDVILTNPPFGGKEGKEAQTHFAYKTSATQVLFLQHVIEHLNHGGRCGIVLDEGVLFRTNEDAFVKTKRKLTDECNLWCIVSLPGGVFSAAGAGVKTNLLFFTKGKPTEKIWYYDLSDIKVGKKTPFTRERFAEFFRLLPDRADSERSWTVDLTTRKETARQQAEPFRVKAKPLEENARRVREQISALKKLKTPEAREQIEALIAEAGGLEKEARELRNEAQSIEDAAYDLKAVNPNTKSNEDTRTPEQLLDLIEAKGREVAEALSVLRQLATKKAGEEVAFIG